MKKIVLIVSVVFVSASMFAVDIFTRTPKKKETGFANEKKEVTKEEAPKYVVPRPDSTVCPVSGVPIDVTDSTPTSVYQNKNYYFLNENSKKQFDKDPFDYAKSIETCDICGRQEKKTRDKSNFLPYDYNGVTYHFDTVLHREEFKANPSKYIIGKENYGTKQRGKKKPVAPPVKAKEQVTPADKNAVPVQDIKSPAVPEVKKESPVVDTKPVAVPEIKKEEAPAPVAAPKTDVSKEEMIEEKTKE